MTVDTEVDVEVPEVMVLSLSEVVPVSVLVVCKLVFEIVEVLDVKLEDKKVETVVDGTVETVVVEKVVDGTVETVVDVNVEDELVFDGVVLMVNKLMKKKGD